MTWPKVKLGDVCEVVSGSTPKTGNPEYWNGDILWVTPKDLSKLDSIYLEATEKQITQAGMKSCSTRLLPAGSVLFSSRAPIGHVAINKFPVCTNQGFKSLIPDERRAHNKFLYFWLRANREYLDGLGNGATFREVSKATVERVEIPLPPLFEQKRLAAILDHADELRRVRRESLARLDELAQSLFLELFGDPATNPKGWDVVRFESVVFFQEGPGVRNWQFRDAGIKLINVRNLVDGNLVLENTDRYLDEQEVEQKYKHFLLDAGDYVMASSGVTWGKIAEVKPQHLPLCLNTSIIRLRPKNDRLTKMCLRAFVESESFKLQVRRLITGSAQPNFGPSHLKQIEIPLPPLSLQQQFAEQIEELEAIKARARASLTELDALFASLQSRAFAGELSGV